MPLLNATSSASTTVPATLVTVNPYEYLASLTHQETYALLACAAIFGVTGALLIQREAAARLFSGLFRSR